MEAVSRATGERRGHHDCLLGKSPAAVEACRISAGAGPILRITCQKLHLQDVAMPSESCDGSTPNL